MGAVEGKREKKVPKGAPMWIVTFSDLMSLLLTFFILLLTMAETKPKKFKLVAGSLKEAFGVQRQVEHSEMPKAESVIKQEYSAGPPQPVTVDTVTQKLQVETPGYREAVEETKENTEKLKSTFKEEAQDGKIEIEKDGADIIIRVKEKASFNSASAAMQKDFIPTLMKIIDNIKNIDYSIHIAGHTDDVPIQSSQYRSNWDLSTARAVTMVHALTKLGDIDPLRVTVQGHADTRPLAPNTSAENRARNRRVEIILKNNKVEQK